MQDKPSFAQFLQWIAVTGAVVTGWEPTSAAAAVTIDFEDLTLASVFSNQAVGATLVTGGATLDLLRLNINPGQPGPAGTLTVVDSGGLGAGKGLNMQSVVLGFRSPPLPATSISFLYADGNLKKNIDVNGDARVFSDELFSLNGQTIGDALITVVADMGPAGMPTAFGTFTVTGPISSFNFGGDDLVINDITATVPEPTAWLLAVVAALVFGNVRRTRRR